jgi:transposase
VTSPYQFLPPLDDATTAALRASIERYGILVPIVFDVEGNVVDGHQRKRIADELGKTYNAIVVVPTSGVTIPEEYQLEQGWEIEDNYKFTYDKDSSELDDYIGYTLKRAGHPYYWPEDVVVEVPDGDLGEIARTLNLDRRHLGAEQRRELVASLHAGGHSLRAIAGTVGVSKSQIERDVKEVSRAGHLTVVPEKVKGLDGKTYPKSRPALTTKAEDRQAADRRVRNAVHNTQRFMVELAALVTVGVNLDFDALGATECEERVAVLEVARRQIESLINRLRKQGKVGEVLGKPTPPDEVPIRPQASS